jgi:phage terminase large subunit-like protein
MTQIIIKKSLDEWLNQVDYTDLSEGSYVPSEFALYFMNFIKLVNGSEGETHKTPAVHLKMLDKTISDSTNIVNLIFRGAAKTTLFMEYFSLFLGTMHYLPNFGSVESMIYVSDSMDNGVASARKNTQHRYDNSEFLQEWLPEAHFTEKYWEFANKDGEQFGVKLFGAQTGLRGTKIFGRRPPLAVLDDLLSDDDARSPTAISSIEDTIYKGVDFALDPTRRKVIFNGTPFSQVDPIVKAVESGGWDASVYPVCESWPVPEEEFVSAWPDRFTYKFVNDMYQKAVATGHTAAFFQELMLRISSDEERLVQDADIRWYNRVPLMERRSMYNFYITTDFATTDKQRSDFSVISVWAYNANGDWFWVDGVCTRQTADKSVNDLFRLVSKYRPQQVGIEVSGQQNTFVKWLEQEMINRNIWFSFASNRKSGEPGIWPDANKLARFNIVVPWFKAGKIYWPMEMRDTVVLGHFLNQIKLVTINGIKGKDDCVDTVSMLGYLKPWKPTDSSGNIKDEEGNNVFEDEAPEEAVTPMMSYVV